MSSSEDSIVMIVGSDAHFIYLMRSYSEKSGHRVIVAPNDEEVMALAGQTRSALVVLEYDLAMPASRGVLWALKADQATCDIPVVVCSWQDEETGVLAQQADSYLQKPVSYETFLATLEKAAHIPGV